MLIGFMLFPSSSAAGSMFRLQGLCRLHPLYPLDLRSGFGRDFPNGWINYGMDKGKGPELCDFHTPLVQSHSIEFIRTPFRKPFAILLEGAIMCDKTQKTKQWFTNLIISGNLEELFVPNSGSNHASPVLWHVGVLCWQSQPFSVYEAEWYENRVFGHQIWCQGQTRS